MNKKIVGLIISLCLIGLGAFLFQEKREEVPPLLIHPNLEFEDVYLELDRDVYLRDIGFLRATLYNNTEFYLSKKSGFSIEYFNSDFWEEVPRVGLEFSHAMESLSPNSLETLDNDLQYFPDIL